MTMTMTRAIGDRAAVAETVTLESVTPRAAAMAHAKGLVRRHGVRLGAINYARTGDGAILVSAPEHAPMRFVPPGHDQR
jgi:hypothetical protein